LVDGTASLDQLRLELDNSDLFADAEQLTIVGYMGANLPNLPNINDSIEENGYRFTVIEIFSNRVMLVRIERMTDQ
jgi:CBS domain containing-hemolysin-like protein